MKNAKFIKNELYKTLYRASDDTYKYAIISFTAIRYEDKDREEFVTFNKLDDDSNKELWKEKLSKKISNYEDFINNNEIWKNEGRYVEIVDRVKYMEPESLSENEFALDSIDQVEITQVADETVSIAFVDIYDQNSAKYNMTCDFDNKDVILTKLISNYEKLCKKGKVAIINKEEVEVENSTKISKITFVVSDGKVKTYIMTVNEDGKEHIGTTTIEKGLNKIENNKDIEVGYKAILDGKCTDITKEEFEAMISILPNNKKIVKPVNYTDIDTNIAEANHYHTNYDNYIVEDNAKTKRIAVFAAGVALLGIGTCYLFRDTSGKNNDVDLKKPDSSSYDNNSNGAETTITTQDDCIVTTIDNNINSNTNTTTISNSNVNTVTASDTNTTTISVTSSNGTTNSTNNTTTNNGYVTTNVPTTQYTGTYRTVNPEDTVISGQTTKTTTKSTTQNVVPSGTVDPRDMVTAGPKPGEQVFTKDGATTTTKTSTTTKSTTSYNKYADLIITGDINAAKPETNKSLVLKK